MFTKTFFKAALSVLFMIIIFFMIDLEQLFTLLRNLDLKFILVAVIFSLLRAASGAFRLFYLLWILFKNVSLFKVSRDSLIAGFYNLFLPTALGGDLPKIFLLGRHLNDKKKIIASVLLERFLGFFSLCTLAMLSILAIRLDMENHRIIFLTISAVFFIFIATLVLISKLSLPNGDGSGLKQKLISVIENLQTFEIKHICTAFSLSLVYQVMGILLVYYSGKALGVKLGVIPYFVALPLIWFTIMIPVSISGIGLREGAFIYFFKIFGVNHETALALSMMFFLQNLLMGSVGGVLLLKNTLTRYDE